MNQNDKFTRLDNGLVNEIHYERDSSGKINWKSMIPSRHIIFNSKNKEISAEIEKIYGAPANLLVYSEVIAKQKVEDKHILVLLAGFQEVAELRGYTSSIPTHLIGMPGYASASWVIDWIPNEEEPSGKRTGGVADATPENTDGKIGCRYLAAMAGNRSFVRAVKAGLNIRVYGYDEIGADGSQSPESGESSSITIATSQVGQPVPTLIRVCGDAKVSFETVKRGATTKYRDKIESDPSTWTKFEDVPPRDCLTLITLVRKGKETAK